MRIATVNVNGIRAAHKRGFDVWLKDRDCDIVAIQEMRCPKDLIPEMIFAGWQVAYNQGDIPGRNGVAIVSREEPEAVRHGFGSIEFDHEGRYIEADFPGLTIASLYLPKGATKDADQAKYDRKMRFMHSIEKYLPKARTAAKESGREFLLMGDLNIAHQIYDVTNYKQNTKMEGFLPEEREWLTTQIGPRKLVDVLRQLNPDTHGPYSWWSWRGQAFTKDVGWRIDYHLATKGLADKAISGGVDRAATYDERTSDHAPVVIDYDLS